ncbi:hypothetical protein VmeM32_00003 [Vibrio phage vB_VmeM-32]|nr:hypothetical protein VmeM32_00003 [Vibrio phage vB_VmeM-32]
MLVNQIHNILITSRNITKHKKLLNDENLKTGLTIQVDSEYILKSKTSTTKLKYQCDECGKIFERMSSSRKHLIIDASHLCYSCICKRSNEKAKLNPDYYDNKKKATEKLLDRTDYDDIKKRSSDTYNERMKEKRKCEKYRKRLSENARNAQRAAVAVRFKDTSHLNLKYYDSTKMRSDRSRIDVVCNNCNITFKKPYYVAIKLSDEKINCKSCSDKIRFNNISIALRNSTYQRPTGDKHPRWRKNKSDYDLYRNQVYKYTRKNKDIYSKWPQFR